MCSLSCRRLASSLARHDPKNKAALRSYLAPPASIGVYDTVRAAQLSSSRLQQQVRAKKTKTTVSLSDLPQGPIRPPDSPLPSVSQEQDEAPSYPTVVLQARKNMAKFENCVLLTRVGGFYELYFEHAEEYGPLLNLKVASKKTNAGPVAMVSVITSRLSRLVSSQSYLNTATTICCTRPGAIFTNAFLRLVFLSSSWTDSSKY